MRMKNLLVIMAITAALGAMTLAESASEPAAQTETFQALLQGSGTVGPATRGGQTTVQISISRWSTDTEREELLRILAEEGDKPMVDALQKRDETGFIRFPGNQTQFPSVRLRYAREFLHEGRRQIVLATDRPIGPLEAVRRPTRTYDYQLTLIVLDLDEDNRGEGVMAVGVQAGLNEETGALELKNISTQPMRLTNVRPS